MTWYYLVLIPPAASRSPFGGVVRVLLLCPECDRDGRERESEEGGGERGRERGGERERGREIEKGSEKEGDKAIINYSIILKVRFASCRPRATFPPSPPPPTALQRRGGAVIKPTFERGNADPGRPSSSASRRMTFSFSVFRTARECRMSINVAPVISK